jgi:hypothetical protein
MCFVLYVSSLNLLFKESGTRITFVPDLARFSLKKDSLNADILQVFRTRCFDIAACSTGLEVCLFSFVFYGCCYLLCL